MPNHMAAAFTVLTLFASVRADAAREITIPEGTAMRVRLESNVGSAISSSRDAVHGRLVQPLVVDGRTVVPTGSRLAGVITQAVRAGKVRGRGRLSLRFTQLTSASDDESYRIATRTWTKVAPATKKKDAAKIGLPAVGGAAIGAIAGGRKGAAIGAAAGGGAGTAVVLSTRGEEVRLGEGHVVLIRLSEPLVIEQ